VKDYPFELTASAVAEKAGGRKEKTREVLLGLIANDWLVIRNCEKQEGSRLVKRDRVGLGETAKRFGGSSSGAGSSYPVGNGFGEVVPDEGTGSERVADE
jgi:hypothetical protein